jgi:hypothetical protein
VFISADPFITEPWKTQNYNRYGYVYNNPLSYIDPSGYAAADAAGCGAGGPAAFVACTLFDSALDVVLNGLFGKKKKSQPPPPPVPSRPPLQLQSVSDIVTGAYHSQDDANLIQIRDRAVADAQAYVDSFDARDTGYFAAVARNDAYESLLRAQQLPTNRIALGLDLAAVIPVVGIDGAVASELTEVAVATVKGSRYANLAAKIGAREFQSNLVNNGYKILKHTVGSNGPVTVLSNGSSTYTIYTATSTGGLSAQLTNAAGEILSKIRLAGP